MYIFKSDTTTQVHSGIKRFIQTQYNTALLVLFIVLVPSMAHCAAAGTLKWTLPLYGYSTYSPAMAINGSIIVGSTLKLYSVNRSGTIDWEIPLYHGQGISIASNGTIYVAAEDMYALNPDGTTKWTYEATGHFIHPAIGDDGTIYSIDTGGYLTAISSNGTRKWRYNVALSQIAQAVPAIGQDGTVYFSGDDYLYAMTPDGSKKWSCKIDVPTSPAIAADGTIYVASIFESTIYALNQDGSIKWKTARFPQYIQSSPTIDQDGTIYIGCNDSYLYALTPYGSVKWKFETGLPIATTPAIGNDGTVYFGSTDDTFYAVSPQGLLKWKYQVDSDILGSPAVGNDGTLYFTSKTDGLHALSSTSSALMESPWPMYGNNPRHTGTAESGRQTFPLNTILEILLQ